MLCKKVFIKKVHYKKMPYKKCYKKMIIKKYYKKQSYIKKLLILVSVSTKKTNRMIPLATTLDLFLHIYCSAFRTSIKCLNPFREMMQWKYVCKCLTFC